MPLFENELPGEANRRVSAAVREANELRAQRDTLAKALRAVLCRGHVAVCCLREGMDADGDHEACVKARAALAVVDDVGPRCFGCGFVKVSALINDAHERAKRKGWWEPGPDGAAPNIPEKLALIHSEISEALEDYRAGRMETTFSGDSDVRKPEGFAVELADAVIRIADLCGYLGIDLENAIELKSRYNELRSYRHGGKRA